MTRSNDREPHAWPERRPCDRCGARVWPDSFRDLASYLEYHITGHCQRCQDRVYLAEPQHRPGPKLPLRDGVVAAAALDAGALDELALLPFVFVTAEARIEWEPRFLLRAGPRLAPLDRFVELTPMRGPWAQHQLRVAEHCAFDHPHLHERLANADLVVGLDRATLDAVRTRCRVPSRVPLACLADEVPWRALYHRPLEPFDRLVRDFGLDPEAPPEGAAPSVLRLAARIAAVLVRLPVPGDPPRTPFHCLLDAHRARFAEGGAETPGAPS